MKKNKGFTLLELLVVIAIIGILSTIVMVSLQGARKRAQDATVEAQLSQIRSIAEIHAMDNDYSYDDLCTQTTPGTYDVAEIQAIAEGLPTTLTCNDGAAAYCVSAPSVSDPDNKIYCLDSTGGSMSSDQECSGTACAAITP
ncbi:MAG: type II secretion system protein [Candidatus Pacebacteria bacterium]|nr:type II secretion system protein [Candidatus Paceibacterota bacterium]